MLTRGQIKMGNMFLSIAAICAKYFTAFLQHYADKHLFLTVILDS